MIAGYLCQTCDENRIRNYFWLHFRPLRFNLNTHLNTHTLSEKEPHKTGFVPAHWTLSKDKRLCLLGKWERLNLSEAKLKSWIREEPTWIEWRHRSAWCKVQHWALKGLVFSLNKVIKLYSSAVGKVCRLQWLISSGRRPAERLHQNPKSKPELHIQGMCLEHKMNLF